MRVIGKILDFFRGPRQRTVEGSESGIYRRAQCEAMRLNHEHVGVEHLFLAIVGASNPEHLDEVRKRVPEGPDWVTMGLEPTATVQFVMSEAIRHAGDACRAEIHAEDLWQALKSVGGDEVHSWAQRLHLDPSRHSPADP